MANKRLSELNELQANQIASGDLLFTTDISALESKKLQIDSLKSYILSDNSIVADNAITSETASYLKYTGIPNGTASYALVAQTVISASYSLVSDLSYNSKTSSYVDGTNVHGTVPSSSVSNTSSYVLYHYDNGKVEYSQTASYCENSKTSSFLLYVPGQYNGTASYAISSGNASFDGTASYLLYSGIPNGTASLALNITNPEITSSYLLLQPGRKNGSSSYAVSSSWSDNSDTSLQTKFLIYDPYVSNGTASYAMNSVYADVAAFTVNSTYSTSASWASSSISSSYSSTSSNCTGTSSYAVTSSYCIGTSSYSNIAGTIIDPNIYKIWGPYSSKDSGGTNTTTAGLIQNFYISPPTVAGTTVILMALLDIKVPLTTTDTDLQTVSLYLEYSEPSNTHSYGPIDTSRPNNYVSLSTTGAFSLSGYSRQSVSLGGDWPNISGSWFTLSVRTTGGALIDVTRGVTFFLYTPSDTTVVKTSYPPF